MGVKVSLIRTKSDGTKVYGLRINYNSIRKTISVGSQTAAKKLKQQVETNLAAGKLDIAEKQKPDFREVSTQYLAMIKEIRAPRTFERYKVLADKMLPVLGSSQIDKITRGDIRSMLLGYYRSGASRASVELMHTVCSGIFSYALDDEMITDIPTRKILSRLDLGKSKKEIHPFSSEEMQLILQEIDPVYRLFFLFVFHTGCRFGEAAAVEWKDIDYRNRTIRIDKTAKDQTVRKATKTYLVREVDMAEVLAVELSALQKKDREECFAAGRKQQHVFHFGGLLFPQQTCLRKLKQACRKIGTRERTIHDIRHTTASMLLGRGAPLTYVSRLLGHSSPRITLDVYSHYMPSENKGAINILDAENGTEYKAAHASSADR